MLDPRYPHAEMPLGGGLHHLPLPQRQSRSDWAGGTEIGRTERGNVRIVGREAHRIGIAAALALTLAPFR